MKNVLITGGAGFISHHLIYYLIKNTNWNIVSLDRLDYSGNLNRLDNILSEFSDEEKSRLLKQLLTNRVFLMTMIGIIIFSVYQLSQQNDDSETDRRKRATREAILGVTIAILAYLDLKAAPFFIIWIVSYYLDK